MAIILAAVAGFLITRAWNDVRDPELSRLVKGAVTDCAYTTTERLNRRADWPEAASVTITRCPGDVAPAVTHVRFERRADLVRALSRTPDSLPMCLVGTSMYVDLLDGGFGPVCRSLDGVLIDAVSRLPELPSDGTIAGIDDAVIREERRDRAAQRVAVRRYFATHPLGGGR